MKLELKDIPAKLAPVLGFLKRYMVLFFILIMLGIFGFLVFRINSLATAEPDEEAVTERLQTTQRPRLDQETLTKIQELQSENIEVQSLFQQARDNPFAE